MPVDQCCLPWFATRPVRTTAHLRGGRAASDVKSMMTRSYGLQSRLLFDECGVMTAVARKPLRSSQEPASLPAGASVVHRFVTNEQVVRATQPGIADLDTLFREWGLTHSTQEAIWVIALDAIENVKLVTEVARGGFHDVTVAIPTVLSAVLLASTDRFYIAHNHPAGALRPTPQDIHMTAEIMAAANVAGLSFEDHLIVGPKGRTFSFWRRGILTRATGFATSAGAGR